MTSATQAMVFVGLFAWGFYRRVRRNIGRQKMRPRRIIVSMVIFSLLSVIILGAAIVAMPVLALVFAGGAGLGVAASFLGLRHTKFETLEDGHYYTPNTYIGVALSMLLLGRMAYRMFLLQNSTYTTSHPGLFQSPLTLFIVGLTFGYYLAYYTGLFVHTHDRKPEGPIP